MGITFVLAPPHLLEMAGQILLADFRCADAVRADIDALARAYIKEAKELERAATEFANAENGSVSILLRAFSLRNCWNEPKDL
jgi:hypothetical protein